jgi:hypothetical protein
MQLVYSKPTLPEKTESLKSRPFHAHLKKVDEAHTHAPRPLPLRKSI